MKAALFGGWQVTTAAVYKMFAAISQPYRTARFVRYRLQHRAGVRRSRGVKVDATGAIVPGIKLVASGVYIDAEVFRSAVYAIGNRLISVPEWSGSLWLMIEPESDAQGARGLRSNTRVDASVWHRVSDTLRLTVGGRNLFAICYVESAVSRAQIMPGEGRGVLIGIGTKS